MTEHLEAALSRRNRISIEGKTQGDWVLIDAGDVIVHLFRPEIRTYYNLEKMWGETLPDSEAVQDLDGEGGVFPDAHDIPPCRQKAPPS